MSSQFGLLKTRRFSPFFVTQFLGAFNDNLFKNALIVLLTFQTAQWSRLSPALLANMAAGLFILPFFLFSATAGQLADKYDKALLARLVKALEIAIMLLVAAGFWLHSLPLLMACLFLLGLQSTFFGPVKYAILPQHLREEELVGGNALVEAGTFVSILVGTLCGGLLASLGQGMVWITVCGLIVALAGYVASRAIPDAPAPEPTLRINPNPITETWRNIQFARENRTVFLSILGISWFWLFGALMLAQFPAYAKDVLGGTETSVTLLLGIFTLGIGIGSLLCERLSAKQVEMGLVPFGSIGLSLFTLDLAFASPAKLPPQPLSMAALLALPSTWHVLFDLFAIGLFGGFFIVPLYALIQLRSSASHRARIIAANNILNALFMVLGAIAAAALLHVGLSIPALFGVAAVCNAAVALYIYRLLPEFLLRFVAWLLVHSVFRLRKQGAQALPDTGPALLVSNHASHVDTLIIASACRRPVRFVVGQNFFDKPIIGTLLRQGKAIAIPTSSDEDSAEMQACHAAVRAALHADEQVVFFTPRPAAQHTAESSESRSDAHPPYGRPLPAWCQQLIAQTSAPVFDVTLCGLQHSPFVRGPLTLWQRLARLRVMQPIAIDFALPAERALTPAAAPSSA